MIRVVFIILPLILENILILHFYTLKRTFLKFLSFSLVTCLLELLFEIYTSEVLLYTCFSRLFVKMLESILCHSYRRLITHSCLLHIPLSQFPICDCKTFSVIYLNVILWNYRMKSRDWICFGNYETSLGQRQEQHIG